MKKGWGESRCRRIARFRLGNEMREGKYWGEVRERECRLCGGEIESWEHVWERCRSWTEGGGNWQEVCERMLGGEGEGKKWLRGGNGEMENKRKGGEVGWWKRRDGE